MPDLPGRVRWEDVAMDAAKRIRDGGMQALDLDAIAGDLGAAPQAVRYWFVDETELLISVMQIRQRWFLDEADRRLATASTYREKLRELIELCVADHDVTYWIELWNVGLRDERARQARQTLVAAYRVLFARLIRAGQQRNEFAAVSPDQMALVLVALVTGLSVEVTVGGESKADLMQSVLSGACERLLEVDLGTAG